MSIVQGMIRTPSSHEGLCLRGGEGLGDSVKGSVSRVEGRWGSTI